MSSLRTHNNHRRARQPRRWWTWRRWKKRARYMLIHVFTTHTFYDHGYIVRLADLAIP